MDEKVIQLIVDQVLQRIRQNKEGSTRIPIAVSARHTHLSQEHLDILFGPGYQLSKMKDLSQPGQFAAQETVTIVGPKGALERVRILGPARNVTQTEITRTEARRLGLSPPLRLSGDVCGSSPHTLVGPKGSVYCTEGLIIAKRHIHMHTTDAEKLQLHHGDRVNVAIDSLRPLHFQDVEIRVSNRYRLEMHIDTDEANAACLEEGGYGSIISLSLRPQALGINQQTVENKKSCKQVAVAIKRLLTERDVRQTQDSIIWVSKQTIITPLAREYALNQGIEIRIVDG